MLMWYSCYCISQIYMPRGQRRYVNTPGISNFDLLHTYDSTMINDYLDTTFRKDSVLNEMLDIINQSRASVNMYPLKLDTTACRLAQQHADFMCKNKIYMHSNYKLTENICMFRINIVFRPEYHNFKKNIIYAWLRSTPHARNLCSWVKKAGLGLSYYVNGPEIVGYAVFIGM